MTPKKQKGSAAELQLEKWLWHLEIKYYHRFLRAGTGSFTHAHDGFGTLDVMFLCEKDAHKQCPWDYPVTPSSKSSAIVGIQMTTQAGRPLRRKKIQGIPWPEDMRIFLFSMETTDDPSNRTRKLFFWKIEQFDTTNKTWSEPYAIPFNPPIVEEYWKETKERRKEERNKPIEFEPDNPKRGRRKNTK
jgi:hypothetical protein